MKKSHIISIGNELLIGDTINTNAAWIGNFLTESGFFVEQIFTIPDYYDLIFHQIDKSLLDADLTIVTGGLGPTHDDITKKVVADLFECDLFEDKKVLKHIENIFKIRGFNLSQTNIEQALVPSTCEVLFNSKGTAPGMWFERERHYLAVLPGVPHEMKNLMKEEVVPKLTNLFSGIDVWATEYFKTVGIPESTLSERIGNLDRFLNNGVGVAYLPGPGGVTIRISASGTDKKSAELKLNQLREVLNEGIGDFLFGKGKDLRLAEVVGNLLSKQKFTIAVAESCTGGYLSSEITDIPGCSEYMKGGVIAYSNESKTNILGVDPETIRKHGAVSKQTALQMAKGVAEHFGSDIGVSTTGIAGPGGGTPEKPVGLVWMGFWIHGNHFALKAQFTKDRTINKKRASIVVLETIRRELLEISDYPYELKPHFP
ncbi:MAG: competence/damage-inducible protein A [Balneolaceae bacterium]